eukprot:7143943-Ditylum_brightwellii.AAC.1
MLSHGTYVSTGRRSTTHLTNLLFPKACTSDERRWGADMGDFACVSSKEDTNAVVTNSSAETYSTSNSDISDTSTLFLRLSINNQAISENSESIGEENNSEDGKCDLVHAGPLSTIYRIEDPDNKLLGGRTGYVALKTHADQFPTEEQIHRLENEYNISIHLSNCAVARNPLRQTLNDG